MEIKDLNLCNGTADLLSWRTIMNNNNIIGMIPDLIPGDTWLDTWRDTEGAY